ncbi:hypothetical protein ACFU5O_01590 [Streptomyces sp. NPDC057445]|uniref:hypothetical protein n=1 Tax=Streptomyces sp. NPDC057445 TaxID=3346136 RepID=UPI003697754A
MPVGGSSEEGGGWAAAGRNRRARAEDVGAHFRFLARILGLDMPVSSTPTRELLGR